MKGVKRDITPHEREQLARWLRAAATSGDGMPSIKTICERFRCGRRIAQEMLEEQRSAGIITMKPGRGGGLRPVAQPMGAAQ